jgi:hypothetical protein
MLVDLITAALCVGSVNCGIALLLSEGTPGELNDDRRGAWTATLFFMDVFGSAATAGEEEPGAGISE